MRLDKIGIVGLLSLMLVSLAPTNAKAQFLPNQTRNRVICKSINSLTAYVQKLPSIAATTDRVAVRAAILNDPNCGWLGATAYFTEAEIGQPLGWLYAGDYLYLLHALTVHTSQGSNFVHASTIVRRSEWRLPADCDVSPYKVSLPTGDNYRFFGRTKAGMKPHCMTLVNVRGEIDRLNRPPVAYSEHWWSRPQWRQANVCRDLMGMANGLDKVVNEQQIRNDSTDVFSRKQGCTQRDVRKLVASRFMGLYWSRPTPGKKEFWFEVHHVIFRDPASGAVTEGYMPVNPVRDRLFSPNSHCAVSQSHDPSQPGQASNVVLYGSRRGAVPGVTLPAEDGGIAIPTIPSTAIGLSDCYIDPTLRRR
ncbi:hypothetical protein [Sphingopyxis sp. 2PD]|uniref:hypothetical protein n=1 Tax=Sphingopyxis sp. 2PD TaxID=2502196 RepID=UPI0010F7005F|nr:hypothetical protein [Sphingopyxis sp. 2PD]